MADTIRNRYAKPCGHCGDIVRKGAGLYDRETKVTTHRQDCRIAQRANLVASGRAS